MMAVDDEGMAVPISAIGGSRIGQMRMARLERVMHMVEFVGIGRGPEDRNSGYLQQPRAGGCQPETSCTKAQPFPVVTAKGQCRLP